jgi:hypothetical protein
VDDDLVSGSREVVDQVTAEVEAGVVGGDVNAHAHSLFCRGSSTGRQARFDAPPL